MQAAVVRVQFRLVFPAFNSPAGRACSEEPGELCGRQGWGVPCVQLGLLPKALASVDGVVSPVKMGIYV